ncbi:MAG: SPOR domain-containing protein [Methylovirgula sp.]
MRSIAGFFAGLCLITTLSVSPADAWRRHRHSHHHHAHHHFRHHARTSFHRQHLRPGAGRTSQFAELVVDGNTGRELYGVDENALRHPASITKVMTLYLLFEQLQKGRLHLDSRIPISAHAAAQPPTKLGLRPGRTISVDNAIKAITTHSSNDIAVAVAEALGGTESNFAAIMTRKAHELGMLRTQYVNASGLPDAGQLTTAHDLAILGRDIQERFPAYYHYFSLRSFRFRGVAYRNHNHLLGRVPGLDGMKTGYTRASGYNLLTSVRRGKHFIIAVVLGGSTWASRDRIMTNLIAAHIDDGSTRHMAPAFAKRHDSELGRHEIEPVKAAATTPAAKPMPLAGTERVDPMQVGTLGAPTPVARPRPAYVSAAPKPMPIEDGATNSDSGHAKRAYFDGSTERPTTSSATPTTLRWVVGPSPAKEHVADAKPSATEESVHAAAEVPSVKSERPAGRSGWMIQIGATDDRAEASQLLARAKAHGPHSLRRAKPFTEKIQKGSETLYRARFAGLRAQTAEAACRSLKHAGFACFAIRD